MRFSQRIGLTPATKIAQRETIDDDLRNSLWSLLTLIYWENFEGAQIVYYEKSNDVPGSNYENLMNALWLHFFKKPVDSIPRWWPDCLETIRKYFFNAKWFEIYDFIEFIAEFGPEGAKNYFTETCNSHLERENSAYRFVDGKVVEITSQQEIDEVEAAIERAAPYPGVKTHLTAAIGLMSSRTNPDYRNSIKESISAVESLAKKWANNDAATLGTVLKALEKSRKLHPALKNAFTALYGYTSDADGIRHSLMSETELRKADARFMLICCSAFVNFVIDVLDNP